MNNISIEIVDSRYLETRDKNLLLRIFDMFQKATLESDYMVKGEISTMEDMMKVLNNKNFLHFIAFNEDVPVGYCQIVHRATSYEFGLNVKINALSIVPEYRKTGLGKKLVQKCLDWSAQNGIQLIYLDVVNKNVEAKNLYIKFGFNKTGELLNAYKNDGEYLNLETYSKNL